MDNFDTFMKKILLGNISLQDPIISNVSDIKTEKLPFQKYLYQYKNINDDNFAKSLYTILNLFRKKFHSLYSQNNDFKHFFNNNLKNDWDYNNDFLSLFKLPVSNDFFNNFETCNSDYEKSLNLYNDFIDFDKNQKSIPIDSFIRNESPMERKISGLLLLFNEIYKNINIFSNNLKDYIQYFKNLNLSILIDLSLKYKSCYNCNNIPPNINKIFLNYIIINNTFYKELIKLNNHINNLLTKIKDNSNNLSSLNNENNNLATLNMYDLLPDFINHKNEIENENENENENEKLNQIINNINNDNNDLDYITNQFSNDFHKLSNNNNRNNDVKQSYHFFDH